MTETKGTPGVTRWRKKPAEVEAIQWDGTNTAEVEAFCGTLEWDGAAFYATEGRTDGLGMVWNERQHSYLTVHPGYLVVRVDGDLTPEPAAGYEPLAKPSPPLGAGVSLPPGHVDQERTEDGQPAQGPYDGPCGWDEKREAWPCPHCAKDHERSVPELDEPASPLGAGLRERVLALAAEFKRESEDMRKQAVCEGLHPALASGHREANLLRECASRLSAAAGEGE